MSSPIVLALLVGVLTALAHHASERANGRAYRRWQAPQVRTVTVTITADTTKFVEAMHQMSSVLMFTTAEAAEMLTDAANRAGRRQ